MLIEVCVDTVESALAAQAGGADRIELCLALAEGGLTPTVGLLQEVRQRVSLPIMVMIRPRPADFCYSPEDFAVMRRDLLAAKELGADGVVLGLLQPDGTIDLDRSRELIQLAHPLPVTFHRAFDLTRDAGEALEQLVDLGAARILTSGQAPDSEAGLDTLTQLVTQAGDRLAVMPGGGIREDNVAIILRRSRAREFHVSASVTQASSMVFRNPRVSMGQATAGAEYEWRVASADRIRAFREQALLAEK
jgi:copper homeostasis protein